MMTHPLWLAQNLITHPFVRAQNLVTNPLFAPTHPLYTYWTVPNVMLNLSIDARTMRSRDAQCNTEEIPRRNSKFMEAKRCLKILKFATIQEKSFQTCNFLLKFIFLYTKELHYD